MSKSKVKACERYLQLCKGKKLDMSDLVNNVKYKIDNTLIIKGLCR